MRKRRVWFSGAYYHVMNRGIGHQDIFLDYEDSERFLDIVRRAFGMCDMVMHAYCLMDNHYHLLIQAVSEPIGEVMKFISQSYTYYYNRKYGSDGPIFKGRYHAVVLKGPGAYLRTIRYIVLNPVKAGRVASPEAYRWSSYRTTLGLEDDGLTDPMWVLNCFGADAAAGFCKYVREGIDSEELDDMAIELKDD